MSYNSLFGLGPSSPDSALEGWWPLMDNAASTTIVDYSGKGRNGTFSTNSNNRSVTGPNGYLATALRFGDSSSDKITISSFSALNGLQTFSFASMAYRTGDGGATLGRVCEIGSNDAGILWQGFGGANVMAVYVEGSTYTAYTPPANEWHYFAETKSASAAVIRYDASETSNSNTSTLSYTGNLCIGNRNDSTRNWAGYLAEFSAWSKTLSTAENGEISAGPEPIYVSGASLNSAGSYSVGTWGLDSPFSSGSNGTVTYSVKAVTAAGTVLDTLTTSTGTLDLSANAGNVCYLMVQATNTGGYDIGDKATRTSAYGSAADGYYELASATASGGGGGGATGIGNLLLLGCGA